MGWDADFAGLPPIELPQSPNDAPILSAKKLSAVLAEYVDFYTRPARQLPLRLARTSRTKSPVIRGGAKFWRSKEA
jgi:hypothetical protein